MFLSVMNRARVVRVAGEEDDDDDIHALHRQL